MCLVPLMALLGHSKPNAIEFCDSHGKVIGKIHKSSPAPATSGTFSTKQGSSLNKILIRSLEPGQTLEIWSSSCNVKLHSSSFLQAEKHPIVVKVQGKPREMVCNLVEVTRSGVTEKCEPFERWSLYGENRHVAENAEVAEAGKAEDAHKAHNQEAHKQETHKQEGQ